MKYINNINLIDIYSRNKSLIKQIVSLTLIFGLFKSLVYFAPLGVNEILNSVRKFGAFEYSLNLGQTLMGVFSMGFAGAYAYFIVNQKRDDLKPIFHLHFIALTACLLLTVLIFPKLLGNIYFGALILGLGFANQVFLSAVLKLTGRNNAAIFIDTGLYIVMAIIVIIAYFQILPFSMEIWFGSILTVLVLTSVFYHSKNINGITSQSGNTFLELYKYGGLIVLAGPLLVLINNSTRLFIEYFSTLENVGIYSFYFRLSSLILIFSRVLIILMFRKMFASTHKELDKYYSLIMVFLFILNLIIFFGLPLILQGNYQQFDQTYDEFADLFLICLFQVMFWINNSLFEPILQRENKMRYFIMLLGGCLLLLFGSLYILKQFNLISLLKIVWVNAFIIFLLFFGQQWILWQNKIVYKKTLIIHGAIGVIFLFTLFIV